MNGPLLKIEHLEVRYGDLIGVSDVSLEVRHNEFVCLVGPSGCGKSTLLRLVAGLVAPTEGAVSIGGTPLRWPIRTSCRLGVKTARRS